MADAATFSAPSQPVLDRDEAARFLGILAPDEEQFLFSSFDDDKERDRRRRAGGSGVEPERRRGNLDRILSWATARQAKGANICCAVQSVRGTQRRKEDVRNIRAAFGEFDEEPRQPFPLAPSIIVETSPGRTHVYWLTDSEAPVLIEDFDGVQRRIVLDYGADANARDVARTLRMPGTWNLKPGREPYLAKIIGGNGARYSRDKILAAFPPIVLDKVKKGPKPDLSKMKSRGGLGRFVEPLRVISPDDYLTWLEVGMALHHESNGGNAGLRIWDAWSTGSEKWSEGECAYRWGTFRANGGATGGKIFKLAQDAGYIRPVPAPSWQTRVGAIADDPAAAEPRPESEPPPWLPAFGFRKRRDGELEFLAGGDEGDEDWQWLCSEIEIPAETSDEQDREHGRLLRTYDRQNSRWHEWAMPMRLLAGDSSAYRGELLSMGVRLSSSKKGREALAGLIQNARPGMAMRCVTRTGWFKQSFVFPDRVIGQTEGRGAVFQSNGHVSAKFQARGTLEEWRAEVAAPAAGNSRLVLALCAAFAAPCLRPAGQDGGGFHFHGDSSGGKTTALHAAGSVWGGTDNNNCYLETWASTANGLEARARIHSDALLCLQELGQADPDAAIDAAYKLANGQGKARMSADLQMRQNAEWRVLFLSDGEITLDDKIRENRKGGRRMAGQAVRVIDIAADAGKSYGVFDNIGDCVDGRAFSEKLVRAARCYYGTAAPAFIEKLAADFDSVAALLSEVIDKFVRTNAVDCGSQVERVAKRFGLLAAAGELATKWGILPWREGEATKQTERCFREWLAARGTSGPIEIEQGIDRLRLVIERDGAARFQSIADPLALVPNRLGFVERSKDDSTGSRFLILPAGWREIFTGFNATSIKKALLDRKMLLPGSDGKATQKPRLPGLGPTRCYVIHAETLLSDAVPDEKPGDRGDRGDMLNIPLIGNDFICPPAVPLQMAQGDIAKGTSSLSPS